MQYAFKWVWILVVVIAYLTVYHFVGTLVYIEGDDATSIAYHVQGRNISIQPPYSPYHGMMDKLLSILPSDETVVRTAAFELTRIANIVMLIFMLMLAFDWLKSFGKVYSQKQQAVMVLVLLLATPELFYFGLVYAPTLVAMCFVLASHLLLRWQQHVWIRQPMQHVGQVILSVALFGLGISFRWNVLTYGLVIAADIFFSQHADRSRNLRAAIIWGSAALFAAYLMIRFSGYGLANIQNSFGTILFVINQAGTSSVSDLSLSESLMRIILTLSPLLTPALAIGILIGSYQLLRTRSWFGFTLLLGILSILPWVRSGVPKFIITVLPVLVTTFLLGIDIILNSLKKDVPYRIPVLSFLVGCLFFPWLVGIQVNREGTAWGPGFEIKSYDYEEIQGISLRPVIGSGMAFPTPEGPRAFYGHAFVLFRDWKIFVEKQSQERLAAVNAAIEQDVPLLVLGWSPDYYLNDLYVMGFETIDPYNHPASNGFFTERRFINSQGQQTSILYREVENDEVADLVNQLTGDPSAAKFVVIGYSQTMRALYLQYPDALQKLGENSAILDVDPLR